MTGVYRVGRASLVITLAAVIYLLALVDIYLEARRLRPLGSRLQTWSARYPVLSRGLILFLVRCWPISSRTSGTGSSSSQVRFGVRHSGLR